MENQKDTQKDTINNYKSDVFYGKKVLVNTSVYDFINKKTEKLVTALYMVTDCIEKDQVLKDRLRLLGVELLSYTHKIYVVSISKSEHLDQILTHLLEILSFLEIAGTMGYISDMNTSILKREFGLLGEEIKTHKKEGDEGPSLSDSMFKVDRKDFNLFLEPKRHNPVSVFNNNSIKDNLSVKDKKTIDLSFIKKDNIENKAFLKVSEIKSNRNSKIFDFIKDISFKKGVDYKISLKDIPLAFGEYSEKTIQRDLNDLIEKGKIKKIGEKRWAKYLIS